MTILGPDGNPLPRPRRNVARPRIRARYDAAASTDDNRRHWNNADGLSANAANAPEVRAILRNRARYEAANNSYCRGITLTLANDTIGTGPRLQLHGPDSIANNRVEREFERWAKAVRLPEKLRAMRLAKCVDGEAFAILTSNDDLPTTVKLDVRLIEADRVTTPAITFEPDRIDGIEFDPSGNPRVYHVLKQHPGDLFSIGQDFDRLPARNVLHWFRCDRPEQWRGVPEIMPALPLFAQLRGYTLSTVQAAATSADMPFWLETNLPPDVEPEQGEPFDATEVERGMLVTLPSGTKASFAKPEHPTTTYDAFTRSLLNEICRCLSMPLNVALGNSSGFNYASGRLDHQTYFKSLGVEQAHCEAVVLDRILAAWLDEAVMVPGLLPEGFDLDADHQWFWPGREHVDPLKEASAQGTRLANHCTTLAAEYAKQGLDWEEQLQQRAKELTLMRELGLTAAVAEPAPEDEPEDEEAEAVGRSAIHAAATPDTLQLVGGELEIEAAAGDSKQPRKFTATAYTGKTIRVAGWNLPLVIDLTGLTVPSERRPILRSHDPERIVGHSTAIEVTPQRVKAAGVVSGTGPAASEVLELSANGFPWQLSIGASPGRVETVERNRTVVVNGQTHEGPLYVVRTATLNEISFVPVGADSHTHATVAASQHRDGERIMPPELKTYIEAQGFDPANLTDKQLASLTASHEASKNPPPKPKPADDLDSILAEARAEDERRRTITATVAEITRDNPAAHDTCERIAKLAIEGKWDATRAQLELTRAARPNGAYHGTRHEPETSGRVIEAAVCMAAGLPTLDKAFDERTLQAAEDRYGNRGLGLAELILHFARRNGFRELSLQNTSAALRAAFADTPMSVQASGPSTYSLPGILSNLANKFLRVGFDHVEAEWRKISAIKSVRDFKEHTSYTLTGDLTYTEVPKGGELEHGTVGEETYANKADTFGRLLGLDRRDLVNDDLGAFQTAGRRLGRGAALKLNDVFWTTFLNNSTFFTDERGNFEDGVATAFGSEALEAADLLFREQVDPNGKPLGAMPKILLVPPALRIAAKRLMGSVSIFEDSAEGGSNPWAGAFEVVSSTYLSNTAFAGASSVAWYLLADPNDLPVIETAFLNGVETPTIATADMAPNRLGIVLSGYHDFGARLQEYRGGVKMKGENGG